MREEPTRVISWSSHQGQAKSPGPAPLGKPVFVYDSEVPPVPFSITQPLTFARYSVFAAPKKAKGNGSGCNPDEPLSRQLGPAPTSPQTASPCQREFPPAGVRDTSV